MTDKGVNPTARFWFGKYCELEQKHHGLTAAARKVVEANYETIGADITGKAPLWDAIDALHATLGEWEA